MYIHCFLLCVLNIRGPIQYLTIYHILVFKMTKIYLFAIFFLVNL